LQQDGFLDKDLVRVADLDKSQRLNSKRSWDRILRSPYIKQTDVLQCFYFFEDHFRRRTNFEFYESLQFMKVLSPCGALYSSRFIGQMDIAYTFYLRTST
jgi:maltose phosphorylase